MRELSGLILSCGLDCRRVRGVGGGIEIHTMSHTCFGNVTSLFSEQSECIVFAGNARMDLGKLFFRIIAASLDKKKKCIFRDLKPILLKADEVL